jgi:hypothetical protein
MWVVTPSRYLEPTDLRADVVDLDPRAQYQYSLILLTNNSPESHMLFRCYFQ